ncbi:MAG TPA: ribokinase [Thermomicrobiaceae bacterium]|nr:ribokinase [Thermomicrobiaceae bacterium]
MGRVVVAGSVNTDIVVRVPHFPRPGETLPAGPLTYSGGGKGANQAVAAARMGASVTMVGAVGDDAFSDARLADLAADGIDASRVRRRTGIPGGVALIEVDDSGQNTIALVAGANGTVSGDEAASGVTAALGRDGVLLCQFELPPAATGSALRTARRLGARTLLNAAPYISEAAELVGLADVLVVNEIEAGQILGCSPVAVDDATNAADELSRLGPSVVVITLGPSGAYLREPGAAELLPAPRVSVVDTTGAGDALVGAMAALIAEGASTLHATRVGVLAGALAVQRAGAQPSLPYRRDVEALLADTR